MSEKGTYVTLKHNLKTKGGLPYEFRALESILVSVLSALEAEMVFMRNLIGGLLAELEDDIDRDKFKRLLHYSRRLSAFQNRAKLVSMAGKSSPRSSSPSHFTP
jgi:magnesium transporter